MSMRQQAVVVTLLAMAATGCAARHAVIAGPGGAGSGDSWATVTMLQAGVRVRIADARGDSYRGLLEQADPEKVSIRQSGRVREFSRADVVRVSTSMKRRGTAAVKGALTGAAAGAAQALALTKSSRGTWTASLAAGWGLIGAAIGAAVGEESNTIVYERVGRGATEADAIRQRQD